VKHLLAYFYHRILGSLPFTVVPVLGTPMHTGLLALCSCQLASFQLGSSGYLFLQLSVDRVASNRWLVERLPGILIEMLAASMAAGATSGHFDLASSSFSSLLTEAKLDLRLGFSNKGLAVTSWLAPSRVLRSTHFHRSRGFVRWELNVSDSRS
jgi:hypothetical protein